MDTDDTKESVSRRYFGKEIRLHMLLIGFFIVILTPVDSAFLPFYLTIGIALVLLSVILAALTTRKNKTVMIGDFIISILLFCMFEYMAIYAYVGSGTIFHSGFLLKQIIALLSISSLYLSTRSLAGMSEPK